MTLESFKVRGILKKADVQAAFLVLANNAY